MLAKNLTDWTHDLCPPYDSRVIITCSVRSSVVIVPYIFDTTFAFPHGIITLTDVFQGNKVYADVHVRSDSGSYDSQSIYLLIHMYCKANTCF
jgi:hypothetical protein